MGERIEEVFCDICGVSLADADIPGPFYYCRRCKRNGNRFEVCSACHAVEVLQAESKHVGKEVHPHFSACQHSSLVRCTDMQAAYPGFPHLRRVLCDRCGHVAART